MHDEVTEAEDNESSDDVSTYEEKISSIFIAMAAMDRWDKMSMKNRM